MYSTQTLIYKEKVRRHHAEKEFRKTQRMIRTQKIMGFLAKIIDPLCAGLAGTWVINDDDMAARTLLANGTYQKLTRSNIFGNAIRFMGYNILQLFKLFLDGANNVLDNVYKMFSFYNGTNVNSYINNLIGFLWIPCVISILILGFQLIFNSKNRPDANKILQNGLIITILVTGMPALLSTTASMTKEFVNGDFNSRGSHTSDQVIAQCLTDYEYLYDWDQQRFVVTDENTLNSYVATNDYTRVNSIDINETIRYDNAGNPFAPNCDKWDSRDPVCMLCTIVTMKSDGTYQCEHIDEPQWWEFFSDSYFYRYDIDYVTCLITLGAMAVAIIFSAIKVARILWELAIYRVLAMFFSHADLHNGEKLKEIIKAFAGSFIVIIVNVMLLKFFMVFSGWLSSQSIDGFSKSVMLISVAIAVIDGPNLCQKLIGVDAGIRSAAATVGAVYAAGKIAHSAGKGAVKIGKGVGEFGMDVATKGAAIGGFAAGAGVEGAKALKSAKSGINTPKDQKQDEKSKKKDEKSKAKAADRSDKSQENRNDAIGRQVAADTPGKMKSDPSYSSDNIEAYEDAAKSIPQGAGKSDAQITDMAEDAYINTHGDQLVDEAAEIRDEAAANGTDMSEKDALTSAFAGKHKDSSAVTTDGTYRGATQGAKNKIDNLQQSQKAQGRSVDSARLSNYSKIAGNARKHQNSEQFRNLPEVQAHTAAAAEMHGRSYDPSVPGSAERVDAYQGNMSTALEHKDEIMSHAQDYMAEQKQVGNKKITEEQAIAHVVANEDDYDMSYGFDRSYSTDIAETLIASDKVEASAPAPDTSQQRSERSRSITGNSGVNQSLGREKQSHDKPRPSVIGSAKGEYDAARSIFGRKKK